MRLPSLSTMAEDYVKLIWKASERGGGGLATRDIAAALRVSASTVSGNLRKLDRDGLIEHTPYYGVVLTPLGQQVAVAMVRRHRLIETFLVQRLGYGWDEVHTEAEALEHAVSETFLDRVDVDLGHPTHDPHGDPIPRADGSVPDSPGALLGTVAPGACGTVDRVSDDDPSLLRYFDELGVALGTHLRVEQVRDYAGVIAVSRRSSDGSESLVDLPAAAATAIWLAPDGDCRAAAAAARQPRGPGEAPGLGVSDRSRAEPREICRSTQDSAPRPALSRARPRAAAGTVPRASARCPAG